MTGRKQFDPQQALDACLRVFWQRGYGGASVADLLHATGLNRGSLYGTFGDKQQLFLSCLERYADTVEVPINAALQDDGGDPRAAIAAMYEAIVRRSEDASHPAGCLVSQTATESGELEQPVAAAIEQLLARRVQLVERLLRAGIDSGRIRADVDVGPLAVYVVVVSRSLSVMHRGGTPAATLREVARHALAAIDAASCVRAPLAAAHS